MGGVDGAYSRTERLEAASDGDDETAISNPTIDPDDGAEKGGMGRSRNGGGRDRDRTVVAERGG